MPTATTQRRPRTFLSLLVALIIGLVPLITTLAVQLPAEATTTTPADPAIPSAVPIVGVALTTNGEDGDACQTVWQLTVDRDPDEAAPPEFRDSGANHSGTYGENTTLEVDELNEFGETIEWSVRWRDHKDRVWHLIAGADFGENWTLDPDGAVPFTFKNVQDGCEVVDSGPDCVTLTNENVADYGTLVVEKITDGAFRTLKSTVTLNEREGGYCNDWDFVNVFHTFDADPLWPQTVKLTSTDSVGLSHLAATVSVTSAECGQFDPYDGKGPEIGDKLNGPNEGYEADHQILNVLFNQPAADGYWAVEDDCGVDEPKAECPGDVAPLAKYEFQGGNYVAEYGGELFTVSGNADEFKFEAVGDTWVSAVIIKASTDVKTVTFDPNVQFGTVTNDGMLTPNGKNRPAISHVVLCAGEQPPPPPSCPEGQTLAFIEPEGEYYGNGDHVVVDADTSDFSGSPATVLVVDNDSPHVNNTLDVTDEEANLLVDGFHYEPGDNATVETETFIVGNRTIVTLHVVDGVTSIKTGSLVLCPTDTEVIPIPVEFPVNDPCGENNATWGDVQNTDDYTAVVDDEGNLIVTIRDGVDKVFVGGEKVVNLGQPEETNTDPCPVIDQDATGTAVCYDVSGTLDNSGSNVVASFSIELVFDGGPEDVYLFDVVDVAAGATQDFGPITLYLGEKLVVRDANNEILVTVSPTLEDCNVHADVNPTFACDVKTGLTTVVGQYVNEATSNTEVLFFYEVIATNVVDLEGYYDSWWLAPGSTDEFNTFVFSPGGTMTINSGYFLPDGTEVLVLDEVTYVAEDCQPEEPTEPPTEPTEPPTEPKEPENPEPREPKEPEQPERPSTPDEPSTPTPTQNGDGPGSQAPILPGVAAVVLAIAAFIARRKEAGVIS